MSPSGLAGVLLIRPLPFLFLNNIWGARSKRMGGGGDGTTAAQIGTYPPCSVTESKTCVSPDPTGGEADNR
jgi:hypothetical protein